MLETLLTAAHPLLLPAFTAWGSPITWLELVAVVLALAMVACNLRVNPLAWPLAILSAAAYALLFADARLYGTAALQLVFIGVAFWGWWQWLRGTADDGRPLIVARLHGRQRTQVALVTLAAWPLLGWLLARGTDSPVPYLDALPTVASITGQLLLARKKVETWAVWLGVNLVSMVLFATQNLWLTVGLYGVFAALSLLGWCVWSRRIAAERAATRADPPPAVAVGAAPARGRR